MFGVNESIGLATLLVFIIMGLIGGLIGYERGRVFGGFIASLFLGPLGWLIAYFLPTAKTHQCPHCGGLIVPGFLKCQNCGSLLGFSKTQKAVS